MNMKSALRLGVITLSISGLVKADQTKSFGITEDNLLKMVKESNPSLDEIEASFLDSKIQAKQVEDNMGYEFYSGYTHNHTKEKPLIVFQPVFSNVNQYKIGVKKYTKYGVVLDAHRSIDTRSSDDTYTDLTTTTDELGIQMDLWRDFMGKVTRAQLSNARSMRKKDQLQAEISKNALTVNVRKLYWSIVANDEKLKITKNLYSAAQKQAKNARKRAANSITDKAEVARFESLVHARKGAILSLEYEREMLIKNLREIFPQLNLKDISLAKVNFNKTIFEVLACTTQIDQQKKVPFEHTSYDEVINLLKGIQNNQYKVDNSYDSVDLKFDLKLKRIGVASETSDGSNYSGDYEKSIKDMQDNDRGAMSAGLLLTVPFGENRGGTAKIKKALTERRFRSNMQKLETNVVSTHHQVKRSVKLLSHVITEQKQNSKQLAIRVKEMKKKYSQARIPEYALIQDEDSLLQSDLNIVDTQLLVVTTILDYISVFNTFPCTFNRN
mgnify:CR=1 FL=1